MERKGNVTGWNQYKARVIMGGYGEGNCTKENQLMHINQFPCYRNLNPGAAALNGVCSQGYNTRDGFARLGRENPNGKEGKSDLELQCITIDRVESSIKHVHELLLQPTAQIPSWEDITVQEGNRSQETDNAH